MPGQIPLSQVAARLSVLNVACKRCDRSGRLSVARLLAQHGPDAGMVDVFNAAADGCPRRWDADRFKRCFVFSGDLARVG